MNLVDRWGECYEGVHRKTSPEEFKNLFCANCMNASCTNSKGSGMSWVQRMATQADRLLNNPSFAHQQDPEFQGIRNLDFKDMLHREISLQISTAKGDWSVPSPIEVSLEAEKMTAALMGKPMPQGFLQNLDPEPEEEPTQDMPLKKEVSSWDVKGSGKRFYTVTLLEDKSWECECPAFIHKGEHKPCKHITQIQKSYFVEDIETDKTEPLPEPVNTVPDKRPPPITSTPSLNTSPPQGGYIIGGSGQQTPESLPDPWAAPKERPSSGNLPVGGTFTFGSKK